MNEDHILEIGINSSGQLYFKPEKERFTMIWRSATEVHWNEKEHLLYSPKPREWSYLDWYKHIVSVIQDEYECILKVNTNTIWTHVPDNLKEQIIDFNSEFQRPL
jgi:hypothetical protein